MYQIVDALGKLRGKAAASEFAMELFCEPCDFQWHIKKNQLRKAASILGAWPTAIIPQVTYCGSETGKTVAMKSYLEGGVSLQSNAT